MAVQIRALDPATDAESCDRVIASLPYHFGQESGIAACAAAVRSQAGFVADDDGDIVGFITLDPPFPETVDITWLAVRADRRRAGIGRLLIERAVVDARERGATLLMVETVGPSEPDDPGVTDGYDTTRAFYARAGFVQLKEFLFEGWTDRAIVLVRVL